MELQNAIHAVLLLAQPPSNVDPAIGGFICTVNALVIPYSKSTQRVLSVHLHILGHFKLPKLMKQICDTNNIGIYHVTDFTAKLFF